MTSQITWKYSQTSIKRSPSGMSQLEVDRLIEVKYNKITQLGILNGDRVRLINRGDRLIEVKCTVNKGNTFWEFDKCPFNRGRPLNRGPLNRGLTVYSTHISSK